MTGPIFDTHAHYSSRAFDADRFALLDSLPGKGVVGVCEQAKRLCPAVYTVPVSRGCGNGSISIHPSEAVRRIREKAELDVADGVAHPEKFAVALPNNFDVEVEFVKHNRARRASFYPGVKQLGPRTVRFSSDAYYDVLRFFMFCL